MKSFAERLKELRHEKGLSQMQLAKALNLSDAIICKWEKNQSEPTAPNILLIANYFDVSVAYLLNQEDEWGNVQLSSGLVSGNNNVVNSHNQIHTSAAQLPADEAELLRLWKKAPQEKRRAILELLK
jgi:transcriptional regulator with XRE-family HTH domain